MIELEAIEALLTSRDRPSLEQDADKFHTFFADLNGKMSWLHALESQMGIDHLWRRGTTVLALGANGGQVDAYFASKHNHSVTAFDLPWIYIVRVDDEPMRQAIRSFHCSGILRMQTKVHFTPSTALPGAATCYDATTFGPSAHSMIQKAGEYGPALLRQAAQRSRRYVIVFQEIRSRLQPSSAEGGQTLEHTTLGRCSPRDNERHSVCRDQYATWHAQPKVERKLPGPFTKAHCNMAPNCMNNEQWQVFLEQHTPGFKLARHGRVNSPRVGGSGSRRVITGWVEGQYDPFYWYVLQRVGRGLGGACVQ